MFHLGFIKRWFKKEPKTTKERRIPMTPQLTPEYLEQLQKEYQYVSTCLNYSNNRFKLLVNQGLNPNILQQVNNELSVRKAALEVQIYALTDYLKE